MANLIIFYSKNGEKIPQKFINFHFLENICQIPKFHQKNKNIGEHKTNVLNDIFITNQIPTSKDIMIHVFSTPKYIQDERYLFIFQIW
jgi:hypothetical protein